MSNHRTGSASGINTLGGVTTVVCADATEIATYSNPLVKGIPVYNKTTKELKICDGQHSVQSLPDHMHPYTHAPLVHSHMFGPNQTWLMANPRLWYIGDVDNHPELIVLDGRDATEDQATYLSTVYTGMKLLSTPIETVSNLTFVNSDLTLTASTFTDPYYPNYLFGEQLTIESVSQLYDQWMTTSYDLSASADITLAFSGGYQYRPMMYVMSPGTGDAGAPFKVRPTPAEWYLEGSNNGTDWTVVDHQIAAASDWKCYGYRVYEVDTLAIYGYVRLRITSWNAGAEDHMLTGLRRFWLFGRKNGVFSLPKLESPHPDFVWVVPITDLYVGLKHEDVGDIGWTALAPQNYPYYRIPCDGSAYKTDTEPVLYASIGHGYDPLAEVTSATATSGTITTDGAWTSGLTDTETPSNIEFTLATPAMLGYYKFDCTGTCKPKSWVVEGYDGESYITLQTLNDVTPGTFDRCDGTFYIDTATPDDVYSKIRINILDWHTNESTIGLAGLELHTHADGYFYVPTVAARDGLPAYIVRENAANDVSTEVIQRLQSNMATLAQTQANLVADTTLADTITSLQANMAALAQAQASLETRVTTIEQS